MASVYLQQLRDAPGFSYIIFDSVVYTRIAYGCLQNAARTPASGTKSTFMGFKAFALKPLTVVLYKRRNMQSYSLQSLRQDGMTQPSSLQVEKRPRWGCGRGAKRFSIH